MNGSSRLALCAGVLGATITVGGSASADWPTARHDARRTGVSTLGSNIKKPAAYWRSRLGGSLGQTQVRVGDANGDGAADVLYVAGGRVVLSSPDGVDVWRSESQGYLSIVDVVDLDQDGTQDVLLGTAAGAAVVSGLTGALEWSEPAGEIGTPGAYRVADVTGDGVPEVWIDTCGCCAIENGSPGVIYSFAPGFAAPKKLGPPPSRSHCGASSNTLTDMDGDGTLELVVMSDDVATLFDATGKALGVSGKIPARAFAARCESVDIDGVLGAELLCFTNTVYGGAGIRGLFALAFRPTETPSLKLLWQKAVSAAAGGDARAPAALAVDLDGNGKLEAAVSGRVNEQYTTFILDGLTGAELATVDGIAAGAVPGASPKQQVLLVGDTGGVTGFGFVSSPSGLNPVWQLAGQRALFGYDWVRASRSSFTQTLLTSDLDGDGAPELILGSTSEPAVLTAYSLSGAAPVPAASHALFPGVAVQAVGSLVGVTGPARLFVSRNDGYVTLVNSQLLPTNATKDGASTVPGLPVGGYYTGGGSFSTFGRAPVAGRLQAADARDAVLVVDSRGDLVRLDAAGATLVAPAKPIWRAQDSSGASLKPADTTPAIVGVFRRRHPLTDPPKHAMAALDASGSEVAGLELLRPPQHDVLPMRVAGSVNLVGMSVDGALNTDITSMSSSGQKLWQQSLVATAGTQPSAVADWNGDGSDDLAAVVNVPRVYSGTTGGVLAESNAPFSYAMPIITDLGAAPAPNMILQGCYLPARALANDLSNLWVGSGPSQPFPYGALASCNGDLVLVEGTFSVPAALAFTSASGSMAGSSSAVVLASGALFATVDLALAAGAQPGQLTDVAISTNLSGADSEPTALVGSTDGYLYALGACTKTLKWALAFQEPVGSPVLADTDGDANDEILVSVADGYLYGIDDEQLAPPDYVWDVDPPSGLTGADVDQISTTSTLHVSWAAVLGASSYEVAVVGGGGSYLTVPEWTNVGAATVASLPGLPLVDGAKYVVGVRAIGPGGKSPDRASDGVSVHFPTVDAGTDASGGAGGADSGTGGAGGQSGAGGDGGPPDAAGSGGGMANNEILSGRACTCRTPGRDTEKRGGDIPLLALCGLAAFARRIRTGVQRRRLEEGCRVVFMEPG